MKMSCPVLFAHPGLLAGLGAILTLIFLLSLLIFLDYRKRPRITIRAFAVFWLLFIVIVIGTIYLIYRQSWFWLLIPILLPFLVVVKQLLRREEN